MLLELKVLLEDGLVIECREGDDLGRRSDTSAPLLNDGLVQDVLRRVARGLPAGSAAAGPARKGCRVRCSGLVTAGRLGIDRVGRRGAGADVRRRKVLAELHDGLIVKRISLDKEIFVVFAILQLFPLVLKHLLVVVVRDEQRR